MTLDLPLIDCHTHIGRLPGVVGEAFTPKDLVYIWSSAQLRLKSSGACCALRTNSIGPNKPDAREFTERGWLEPTSQ